MSVLYKSATYEDFKNECGLLREMHFLEVMARRGAALMMDDDWFDAVEDNGGLRIILAYDDDEPVGYITAVVHDVPIDDSRQCATTNLVYAHPDYRQQLIGITMFKLMEAELRASTPKGTVWQACAIIDGDHEHKRRDGLKRLGFTPREVLGDKVLN